MVRSLLSTGFSSRPSSAVKPPETVTLVPKASPSSLLHCWIGGASSGAAVRDKSSSKTLPVRIREWRIPWSFKRAHQEVAEVVSSLPLPAFDMSDQPVWAMETSGILTARSAYCMLAEDLQVVNWGRKIWRAAIQPRKNLSLWTERNRLKHDGDEFKEVLFKQKLILALKESGSLAFVSTPNPQSIPIFDLLGLSSLRPIAPKVVHVLWKPPLIHWVKVNTDRSFCDQAHSGYGGFPTTNTLRDDDEFIGYYGDQVAGKTSNSFKEEYGDVVATTSDKYYHALPNRQTDDDLQAFPEEAWRSPATSTFNVMNYGAVGNGEVDDTQAFLKAWGDVCGSTQGIPTLIIPKGKHFLLNSVKFQGPCRAASVNFQLNGSIVAQKDTTAWRDKDKWVQFDNVQDLIINGGGQIDGQGLVWWRACSTTNCKRPTALHINNCHGLRLSDITHIDSARNHISISSSNDVEVSGDDCIAINSGTSHVNITGVLCGPGHGISTGFGTLHDQGSAVQVSDVTFRDFQGSVSGDVAITLDCENRVGCKNIVMDHIDLTSSVHGKKAAAYCKNVRGLHTSLSPSLTCD
ncbi:hypothetical protein ACLB2K_073478 [Fragaria x ananassa]